MRLQPAWMTQTWRQNYRFYAATTKLTEECKKTTPGIWVSLSGCQHLLIPYSGEGPPRTAPIKCVGRGQSTALLQIYKREIYASKNILILQWERICSSTACNKPFGCCPCLMKLTALPGMTFWELSRNYHFQVRRPTHHTGKTESVNIYKKVEWQRFF